MPRKTRNGRACLWLALSFAVVLAAPAAPALAQSCSAPGFTQPPVYPVGRDVRSLASADFDGDGRADLAVADVDSDSVTVLTKVGRDVPAAANSYSVGRFPIDVAAADFNGDARPDIVTANYSSGNVSVLLNDGNGGFFHGGAFAVGVTARALIPADFNSDGKLDLAVVVEFSGVVIILGNGQGGFGSPATFPVGQQPDNVVAADFNGDNKLDLAVTIIGTVQILRGDGTGFFTRVTTPCAQVSSTGGIAAADLNADGRPDLVTTNILGNNMSVSLNDGAGCFGAPNSFNGTSEFVDLADLNADNKLDIIGGTAVWLGAGGGAFGPVKVYGSGSAPGTPGGNSVVRDFDGDGKLDIGTAGGGTAGVLFGDGAGGFQFAAGPAGRGAFGLAPGDFNGDTRLDLAVLALDGVALKLGDGAGGFGPLSTFPAAGSIAGPVAADFNRDSKLDVAALDLSHNGPGGLPRVHVLLGNGAGALGAPVSTSIPDNQPATIATGDFNGDSNPDVVVLNRSGGVNLGGSLTLLLGNGAGQFSAPATFSVRSATNPKSLGVADLNGDGRVDLAVPSGGGFSVMLGDGAGGFPSSTLFITANAASVAVGDFNSDGKPDLALAPHDFTHRVSVVLGDGAGGFGAPTHYSVRENPSDLTVADFNADGKADIAVASGGQPFSPNRTLPAVSVLLGDGAGGFAQPVPFAAELHPGRIVHGDFNGDGAADLATSNESVNSFSLFRNTCAAGTSGPAIIQFSSALFGASEGAGGVTVTVTRTGSTTGPASVRYATSDGTANSRTDYISAFGTLRFADGESMKSFTVLLVDDKRVGEDGESLNVKLSAPVGATLGNTTMAVVTIGENDPTVTNLNPIDEAEFFARQHYLDFLNRQPDDAGLAFWAGQITECETRPEAERAACREVRRVNVSAAFFLSIEFQETGYLVYRTYKAAFGDATSPNVDGTVPVVRLDEFLADTQQLGQGVIVGQGDWFNQLVANKQAFALEFVQRPRFLAAFPLSLTAAQFVDGLNQNAGGVLPTAERDQLVAQLSGASDQTAARAAVLTAVAEHQALRDAELNRAFVLMQYFGYMRRNPDDPQDTDFRGWKFWLDKLNEHHGNFVTAEMVKAFITSIEYRERFNSPSGF